MFGKLSFSEHQWLAEVKYCDVRVETPLLPILRVLGQIADRVALLSVFLGEVVVPGPHCDVLGRGGNAVSGSEDMISGQEGTSTESLFPRYRQADLPGIFIHLNILSVYHPSSNLEV